MFLCIGVNNTVSRHPSLCGAPVEMTGWGASRCCDDPCERFRAGPGSTGRSAGPDSWRTTVSRRPPIAAGWHGRPGSATPGTVSLCRRRSVAVVLGPCGGSGVPHPSHPDQRTSSWPDHRLYRSRRQSRSRAIGIPGDVRYGRPTPRRVVPTRLPLIHV